MSVTQESQTTATPEAVLAYLNRVRGQAAELTITGVEIAEATDQLGCGAEEFRNALNELAARGEISQEQAGRQIRLGFPAGPDQDFSFDDETEPDVSEASSPKPAATDPMDARGETGIRERKRRKSKRKAAKAKTRGRKDKGWIKLDESMTIGEAIAALQKTIDKLDRKLEPLQRKRLQAARILDTLLGRQSAE